MTEYKLHDVELIYVLLDIPRFVGGQPNNKQVRFIHTSFHFTSPSRFLLFYLSKSLPTNSRDHRLSYLEKLSLNEMDLKRPQSYT